MRLVAARKKKRMRSYIWSCRGQNYGINSLIVNHSMSLFKFHLFELGSVFSERRVCFYILCQYGLLSYVFSATSTPPVLFIVITVRWCSKLGSSGNITSTGSILALPREDGRKEGNRGWQAGHENPSWRLICFRLLLFLRMLFFFQTSENMSRRVPL